MPSSPMNWSADAGAIACGAVQCARSVAEAEVTYICPYSPAMSAYATTRRLRAASNAGAGYVPPARNAPPEMLKQPGGKTQTGFTNVANWNGVDHVAPPSVDFVTYKTVPLPPCTPLSNVR